jgi:hypothetical protein
MVMFGPTATISCWLTNKPKKENQDTNEQKNRKIQDSTKSTMEIKPDF